MLLRRTSLIERWMLIAAGFLLVYPHRVSDVAGFGLIVLVLALQFARRRESRRV